jgi:hypothetical protein
MTLDTGRLSSGTATDGTLKMRMHCRSEEKRPSIYGAQLKLQPGKKIELIMEPSNSDYSRDVCQQDHVVKHEKAVDRLLAGRRPDIFRWIAAILIFALFAWVIVEYFDFF